MEELVSVVFRLNISIKHQGNANATLQGFLSTALANVQTIWSGMLFQENVNVKESLKPWTKLSINVHVWVLTLSMKVENVDWPAPKMNGGLLVNANAKLHLSESMENVPWTALKMKNGTELNAFAFKITSESTELALHVRSANSLTRLPNHVKTFATWMK